MGILAKENILKLNDIVPHEDRMRQLSLLDMGGQNQPVPIHVADRWDFDLTYYIKNGKYLYSVNDWLHGMGMTHKQSIKNLLARVEGGTIQKYPLPIGTTGGKQITNFTDEKGLYTLAQEMRVTKTRPQLEAIKNYLSDMGVFGSKIITSGETPKQVSDSMQRHLNRQGYTEQYKQERIGFSDEFKRVNAELIRTIESNPKFGAFWSMLYKETTGMTTKEIINSYEHSAKSAIDALGSDCVYGIKMVIKSIRLHLEKFPEDHILDKTQQQILHEVVNLYAAPMFQVFQAQARLQGIEIPQLGGNTTKQRLLS
jgi:hypothetical protein